MKKLENLTRFNELNDRLQALDAQRAAIKADLIAAQDSADAASEAARQAVAAMGTEGADKKLQAARRAEQKALERVAELEQQVVDYSRAMDSVMVEVVQAERAAKIELQGYWQGEAADAAKAVQEIMQHAIPAITRLFYAKYGATSYPDLKALLASDDVWGGFLKLKSQIEAHTPDMPVRPPESRLIPESDRMAIRELINIEAAHRRAGMVVP